MIKRKFEDIDDFGENIMKAEIEFDKPVLRSGVKHCRHFFIAYQTEEELENILKEFTDAQEVFVEPVEEKETDYAIEEINE